MYVEMIHHSAILILTSSYGLAEVNKQCGNERERSAYAQPSPVSVAELTHLYIFLHCFDAQVTLLTRCTRISALLLLVSHVSAASIAVATKQWPFAGGRRVMRALVILMRESCNRIVLSGKAND